MKLSAAKSNSFEQQDYRTQIRVMKQLIAESSQSADFKNEVKNLLGIKASSCQNDYCCSTIVTGLLNFRSTFSACTFCLMLTRLTVCFRGSSLHLLSGKFLTTTQKTSKYKKRARKALISDVVTINFKYPSIIEFFKSPKEHVLKAVNEMYKSCKMEHDQSESTTVYFKTSTVDDCKLCLDNCIKLQLKSKYNQFCMHLQAMAMSKALNEQSDSIKENIKRNLTAAEREKCRRISTHGIRMQNLIKFSGFWVLYVEVFTPD